jgi:predicted butyrate kinase (DUF1464 family)
MRVTGIDPGTLNFDLCGLSNGRIILDTTISSLEANQNPDIIFQLLDSVLPLDLIVGHSGMGIALKKGEDVGDLEIVEMLLAPRRELEGGLKGGTPDLIQAMYKLYKSPKLKHYPFIFIPGVIHLPTVPEFRKANRVDMGTADKLCCAVLGVKDQAERLRIPYDETSFILIELGFGFNCALTVERGKIVDGLGGTNFGPSFLTLGSVDAELARILPHIASKERMTRLTFADGGTVSISRDRDLTPEKFIRSHHQFPNAWQSFIEATVKAAASLNEYANPKEIMISGRLSGFDELLQELNTKLSKFAPIRKLEGLQGVKVAKQAAQGAAILANGLAGGEFKEIVDNMEIRGAKGSLLDHIHFWGIGKETREIMKRIWQS